MKIFVNGFNCTPPKFSIDVNGSDTIGDLYRIVWQKYGYTHDASDGDGMGLAFACVRLLVSDFEKTLSSYNIQAGDTIDVLYYESKARSRLAFDDSAESDEF